MALASSASKLSSFSYIPVSALPSMNGPFYFFLQSEIGISKHLFCSFQTWIENNKVWEFWLFVFKCIINLSKTYE